MTPDMWTTIRLPKRVRRLLHCYIANLTVARNKDRSRFPRYLHDNPIAAHSAVEYLLEQQRRHGARAGASKLAKAKNGR